MAICLTTRLPYTCRKCLATGLLSAWTLKPRFLSTDSPSAPSDVLVSAANSRVELLKLLYELRALGTGLVSPLRLQLAINNLSQDAGAETIRVAILGVADGKSAVTAKEVIRALLADPLVDGQEWEAKLAAHDTKRPLVLRIGKAEEAADVSLISQKGDIAELQVAAPGWDQHNIEFLFVEDERLSKATAGELSEEALLEVPTTVTGQTVVTPVHKTLGIASGLIGVSTLGTVKSFGTSSATKAAINIEGYSAPTTEPLPFITINVHNATKGISLFRESPGNGMQYQNLWNQSNLQLLRSWLQSGATSSTTTKPIVRSLISSFLSQTESAITTTEQRAVAPLLTKSTIKLSKLTSALATWSESAHKELQDELDFAFTGCRWRQLKWWKLFWRVDDVALLTSKILHDRFLPNADKSMIFLAGRISEGIPSGFVSYSQPMSIVPSAGKAAAPREPLTAEEAAEKVSKWPTHIEFTRRYLQQETVPALQALAQKLVVQTASSTGLSGALGALLYASQFSVYEAGSVVALGTVMSLGIMQRKWEEARRFWEGEVREEGRKAVRGAEKSIGDVLEEIGKAEEVSVEHGKLKKVVGEAKKALERLV